MSKSGPLDWRTLRLCQPEQAQFLVLVALPGPPLFILFASLGSVLHTFALPVVLMVLYLVTVGALALRLFAAAKVTLDRLDPDHQRMSGKPEWATEEMPGEL